MLCIAIVQSRLSNQPLPEVQKTEAANNTVYYWTNNRLLEHQVHIIDDTVRQ